ncbi:hypothetical protein [Glutamicibacter sp.]|uniref:hypothetical protein n=1 Tax=Glutamicibacter sp. TaxID=1931995 RepID=UPI0028BE31C2|nr:hypothetical protein [Glutamicibacter sp.]
MKKQHSLLAVGLIALTSCTTPVSELKTDQELNELRGSKSAWDTEQQEQEAGSYNSPDSAGPLSTLVHSVVKTSSSYERTGEQGGADEQLRLSANGIFYRTYDGGESGEQHAMNYVASFGEESSIPGNYFIDFSCRGVGEAALEVYLDEDFPTEGTKPQLRLPINCADPAVTANGTLTIPDNSKSTTILIAAGVDTVGSYEYQMYTLSGGKK